MGEHTATNKKEIEEFLQVIETDFYLYLDRYTHYADKKFETNPLSITELLQICESYIMMEASVKHVHNEMHVGNIMYVIWDRVSDCGDNKLQSTVTEIILDMECSDYVNQQRENDGFDSLKA